MDRIAHMTTTTEPAVLTVAGLVDTLARNVHVVGMQAEGLSHADSLLQPQPRGNCFNWVAGHILVFRQYMLAALGQESLHDEDTLTHYKTDSTPITADGEGVRPFANLLKALGETQDRIANVLATTSASTLAEPSPRTGDVIVAEDIFFLMWHETYHVGQTELLRQLTGVNDKLL
jgi:uncharacterized damage-inducible protein DinB